MATFRDGNGREWHINVTVADVKRVKEQTGLLLTSLVEDKLLPLAALVSDPVRLVDTVWVLVEPQAKAAGLTDEQFGQSLSGDSVDQMANAFMEALTDFFPKRQSEMLKMLLVKQKDLQNALADRAEVELSRLTVEQLIESVMSSVVSAE
jgi:hypothetical protein